jgi:hypothetical protein
MLGTCILSLLLFVAVFKYYRTPASKYGNASQVVAEYRDESKNLQLASGWRWPTKLAYQEKMDDGKRLMYEVNTGKVDAAWYWHCSWASAFFSATDPDDRTAAMNQVLRLRDSAFYRWGLDAKGRRQRDEILADARAGNVSNLKQVIDLNCPRVSE